MHFQLEGLIPISGGIYSLLLAWRVIPVSKDLERSELWHRKFGKMMKILGVATIGFGFLELSGVLDTDSSSQKKYNSPFAPEFEAAVSDFEKAPPGIERANQFIASLKAIAAHPDAPPALKQALNDYIAASQDGLEAMKAGRDLQPYNDKMADSKKRIQAALQN